MRVPIQLESDCRGIEFIGLNEKNLFPFLICFCFGSVAGWRMADVNRMAVVSVGGGRGGIETISDEFLSIGNLKWRPVINAVMKSIAGGRRSKWEEGNAGVLHVIIPARSRRQRSPLLSPLSPLSPFLLPPPPPPAPPASLAPVAYRLGDV